MVFKINIADKEKGLSYHLDSDSEAIIGLKIGEVIKGEDIDSKLAGYEFEIKGMSDKAGFPSIEKVEGTILKRVLLTYGKCMKEKTDGLRKRKTVRGNTISVDSVQINLAVKKKGEKSLAEIFPEQCKPKEKKEKPEQKAEERPEEKKEKQEKAEEKPAEKKTEEKEVKEKKAEEKPEAKKPAIVEEEKKD